MPNKKTFYFTSDVDSMLDKDHDSMLLYADKETAISESNDEPIMYEVELKIIKRFREVKWVEDSKVKKSDD